MTLSYHPLQKNGHGAWGIIQLAADSGQEKDILSIKSFLLAAS
jgi:hypothetical protein